MARVVVHIHSLGLGGAERVALQWAGWLRREGHEVVLLTGPPEGGQRGGSDGRSGDFYGLPAGLQRAQEAPLPGVLRRLGGLAFPLRLGLLRRWLQAVAPDLVISVTTRPAIKMLLAAWGLPLAVVVAERNHPGAKPLGSFWRLLRRLAYPRAALLLVQTEQIADWFGRRGLGERTAVLPNALQWPLPPEQPVLLPDRFLDPSCRVVLAAGTKPHQKGFDLLVDAFGLASRRCPGWRLVIAGLSRAEWPRTWPWPMGDAAPLLLGRVGNLGDWYGRADLFVLSSRYEGFPNVLLEAMASGTACLAVDCPSGPAELIDHGRNGWLLPLLPQRSAMAEAMASAMAQLMAAEPRRRALAAAARDVHARFAEERIRGRLLDLLQPWLVGEGC